MKLNTCDGHDGFVVVYEGWGTCPVCESDKETETLLDEKEDLEEKVGELEDSNQGLESKVDVLEADIVLLKTEIEELRHA